MPPTAEKIPIPTSLANLDLDSDLPSPHPTSTSTTTTPTTTPKTTTLLCPHTLPPRTRNSLLTHLHTTASIPTLSHLLTRTLAHSPTATASYPSLIHALSLDLLRSGLCAPNFQDLITEITRRALTPQQQSSTDAPAFGEGERVGTIVLPSGSYGADGLPDVRVPAEVVRAGVGFLTERVRGCVEVVADDRDDEEGEGHG